MKTQQINQNIEGSILLLDDDKTYLLIISEFIEDRFPSIKISTSNNKKKAMEMIDENMYDLLILDIRLGGDHNDLRGGIDVLNYAKKKYKLPFCSIAISQYDEYAFDIGKGGFDVFVNKPVDNIELEKAISKQFRALKKEREKLSIGTAFCIMPFSEDFLDIYLYGIKASSQSVGFECFRIDEKTFTKDVLTQIHKAIEESDIIIADLTGNNPNVYYEVGYAFAKEKTVVLIAQNSKDVVFDLRNYNLIIYNNRIRELREKLEKILSNISLDFQNNM